MIKIHNINCWALIAFIFTVSAVERVQSTPIPMTLDKHAVQFVFSKSGTNYNPSGTCFLVGVKSYHIPHIYIPIIPFIGKPLLYSETRYIVTARHVLFDVNTGQLLPNLYMRIDNQAGGLLYLPLSDGIANGTLRVLAPVETNVDMVVVAPWIVPTEGQIKNAHDSNPTNSGGVKFGTFKSSLVLDNATLKTKNITEGEEMFFVGLFVPFYGNNENIPICRFGHLAMMPNEPVPFGKDSRDLYLMETDVFGGNSGSPAFFTRKKDLVTLTLSRLFTRDDSDSQIILAGVVSGYYNDFSQVIIPNTPLQGVARQNNGIAAIVPASYLNEILFSKEEKKARKLSFKFFRPHGYF